MGNNEPISTQPESPREPRQSESPDLVLSCLNESLHMIEQARSRTVALESNPKIDLAHVKLAYAELIANYNDAIAGYTAAKAEQKPQSP